MLCTEFEETVLTKLLRQNPKVCMIDDGFSYISPLAGLLNSFKPHLSSPHAFDSRLLKARPHTDKALIILKNFSVQ